MNYLAHFLLAFDSPEILIGQFIADKVKGKSYEQYPTEIQKGILLHRFVDSYTDSHAINLQLRSEIRVDLGLYSSIAIDVFYDHFLAKSWQQYHPEPLTHFSGKVYEILMNNSLHMPEKMKIVMDAMIAHNWLENYQSTTGIERTLKAMSGRIGRDNPLHLAPQTLNNQSQKIGQAFEMFFPELIVATKSKFNTFATNPNEIE